MGGFSAVTLSVFFFSLHAFNLNLTSSGIAWSYFGYFFGFPLSRRRTKRSDTLRTTCSQLVTIYFYLGYCTQVHDYTKLA